MMAGLNVVGSLDVPPRKASGSGFPLQVRARITGLAGFPFQSLTRAAHKATRPFSELQVYIGQCYLAGIPSQANIDK